MDKSEESAKLRGVGEGRIYTPFAIELILAQYRMSRIEEIVTRNVFRAIWVIFSVYLSATTIGINGTDVNAAAWHPFLLGSLAPFLVACMIYITSRGATNYIGRRANAFRDLLVSMDYEFKDSYVRALYREELRGRGAYSLSGSLLGREELLWFSVVVVILYLRVMLPTFAQ